MSATNPIAIVRRTQSSISRDFTLKNLSDFLTRDAFREAASQIVSHHFPLATANGNASNIELLRDLYVHALVLAPLIYRMPGSYRPDWSDGTVLSWLRTSISEKTKQWFVADLDFSSSITRDAESMRARLHDRVRIRDDAFLDSVAETLSNLAASGGRKSEAARLFADPFCCAADDEIFHRFHTSSNGRTRAKLRAALSPVGSYFRRSSRGLLVADLATVKQCKDLDWKDIRHDPICWGDYRVTWHHKEKRLHIVLDRDVLAAAYREVRAIFDAANTPFRKLKQVERFADVFFAKHRYTTGSLEQLLGLDIQIAKLVRRKITATAPSQTYEKCHVAIYNGLVKPIPNPFLSPDSSIVSNETWMHFWNPYR